MLCKVLRDSDESFFPKLNLVSLVGENLDVVLIL